MRAFVVGAILVVVWPVVLSRFGSGDVYLPLGALALCVIAAVLFVSRARELLPRTGGEWVRDIGIGVGTGAVMTVGTYVAYAISQRWIPSLAGRVGELYRNAGSGSFAMAMVATVAVIFAEEILWRGPLLRPLERKAGRGVMILISLGTYTLAQGGSRSVVVMLAALICGAIWLLERLWTRSLIAPLLSHLMWTLIVVHLLPVTRF